jgi:hypothetical protein
MVRAHRQNVHVCTERDAAAFACVQRYAPDKAYVCVSAVTAALAGRPVRSTPSERLPPGLALHCKAATVTDVREKERDVFKGPMWKTNFVRKTRTPEETVSAPVGVRSCSTCMHRCLRWL